VDGENTESTTKGKEVEKEGKDWMRRKVVLTLNVTGRGVWGGREGGNQGALREWGEKRCRGGVKMEKARESLFSQRRRKKRRIE